MAVVEALKLRDPRLVESCMREHIHNDWKFLMNRFSLKATVFDAEEEA